MKRKSPVKDTGVPSAAAKDATNHKRKHTEDTNLTPSAARYAQLQQQRQRLPIYGSKAKVVSALEANMSLVVVGETGSGKTTQLPQFLEESGLNVLSGGRPGCVAVTQPRRVAAITVAQRVAQERGAILGEEVGYNIRFDDKSSKKTRIKYVTDGMLLREAILDPLLSAYSCVVLDEAHERTIHTDMLFGVVKQLQATKRPDLRIVIMSATLQAELFAKYFSAPVLFVEGRQYPVDLFYTIKPEADYLDAALITVLQIHLDKPVPGDILVFLTGAEEIQMTKKLLEDKAKELPPECPSFYVTPIYAALPPAEQLKAFLPCPAGVRKIILATNIAETSVTVDGIKYVVDSGVAKARQFDARSGMDCLVVVPVSKAEAWQRCGRAGRQQAGECYRLYTEASFDGLRESLVPEILRCNLSSIALQLKALRVSDPLSFDFMTPPPREAMIQALEVLYSLGALDQTGKLTRTGHQMARFPLGPMHAKCLLAAKEFGCAEQVLTIIAMLSVESVFFVPAAKMQQASTAKHRFAAHDGDHLTLLNVFDAFLESKQDQQWCTENFINYRSMKRVIKVRQQLEALVEGKRKVDNTIPSTQKAPSQETLDSVRRALVAGFFLQAARLQPDGSYQTMKGGLQVYLHPSSVLTARAHKATLSMGRQQSGAGVTAGGSQSKWARPTNDRPECVVYNELILTSKRYMREACVVDMAWLPELAPNFYQKVGASATATPTRSAAVSGRSHNAVPTSRMLTVNAGSGQTLQKKWVTVPSAKR